MYKAKCLYCTKIAFLFRNMKIKLSKKVPYLWRKKLILCYCSLGPRTGNSVDKA